MRSLKSYIKLSALLILLFAPLLTAANASAQGLSEDLLKGFRYRSTGPTRQSGRFVDFAVPEQEPYTFYAATGSGGLWKSVNNGTTFFPIFDFENVFSIGDIAVAPSDPKIIWVGSGEANNSRSTYWGDGVYKSTDAGNTWKNMGLKDSHHIGRIIVHPKNPDIVYVAALGHLYSENPDCGLYKTTDAGKTWNSRAFNFGGDNHALWIDPKDSNRMLLGYDHGMGITYDGESEPNGIVVNYYLKNRVNGDVKLAVYKGDKLVNEVVAKNMPGINQALWDMTQRRPRTDEEKKAAQERMRRFAEFEMQGRFDPNYEYTPAPTGEYKFVLTVGTQPFMGFASILKDQWCEK